MKTNNSISVEEMKDILTAEAEEYFKIADTTDYQNFVASLEEKEEEEEKIDFNLWFSHLSKKEQDEYYQDYLADQVLLESESI